MAGAALGSRPDAGTRLCRSDNGLGFCGMTKKGKKKKNRRRGSWSERRKENEEKQTNYKIGRAHV